ncbi:hypothetical protein Pint_35090 [Pistacia integerrima]|uniref:Uncharacterized protein n=1 Tax=Pistacia integerrima TaxID=434235 RepID=A0ACC0Y600_9ROSI|nr:hypothetical protein Pint_35090 [Pistacia integerrima]
MSEETPVEVKEDKSEIASFNLTKKKKKKKKKVQPEDKADEFVDNLADQTENFTINDGAESSTFGLKKKKKRPVKLNFFNDENVGPESDSDGNVSGLLLKLFDSAERMNADARKEGKRLPCLEILGKELIEIIDMKSVQLLSRMFNMLRENNPELVGDRRRTVMRPPQILLEGTKKTVFVNFMDLCKTMHRQAEDVMTFLLAEMGTSGSLDGQQRLVVKGRFPPKNFEGILHRYINEYVICNDCRSPDTILTKENLRFFLSCEQCGSVRSVAPIETGFVARVGRQNAGT